MDTVTVKSSERVELIAITDQVASAVRQSGLQEGAVLVYTPHTTAGVTINENADPDVARDIIHALNKEFPDLPGFRHTEGNSDAHVRSSVIGCAQWIPVQNGKLALGTWQGVFFCEFDGPRSRKVHFQFLPAVKR
jgi:secondary thiamine-phosphate synthase enzyme